VNVKISTSPIFTLVNKVETCFNITTPYLLSIDNDPNIKYLWKPNLEIINAITVSEEGTYTVKATNADGCSTEKSVLMLQRCVSKILAPNIFTPNGDGDNDFFLVSTEDVSDFQLKIFNRWGEMMFSSNTESEVWDGNFQGSKAPEGTYTYQLNYKNARQPLEILTYSGMVLLVR
jgi:gliding motility-associated-like protein